jgi:hypothetical protein
VAAWRIEPKSKINGAGGSGGGSESGMAGVNESGERMAKNMKLISGENMKMAWRIGANQSMAKRSGEMAKENIESINNGEIIWHQRRKSAIIESENNEIS